MSVYKKKNPTERKSHECFYFYKRQRLEERNLLKFALPLVYVPLGSGCSPISTLALNPLLSHRKSHVLSGGRADEIMADEKDCRVLSIQSSVVYGYVGNKSATFPLQVLGFDVSTINSVQFSNHTGYGKWEGQVLNASDVSALFEGLRMNNLLRFSHVLTGYIGSESFLEKVGETVAELRKSNPELVYVCDPVMGDNGKLYVRKELIPVYREKIITLADIITPNQFELEILTDSKITTEEEAFVAINKLHDKGVKTIVLSSSDLGSSEILVCLASTAANGGRRQCRLEMPHIDATFVGTGDLFAALLLAWMHRDGDLKKALEKTIATLQAVIKRTLTYATRAAGEGKKPTPAQMELRLVQSKADIENPQVSIRTQDVPLTNSTLHKIQQSN